MYYILNISSLPSIPNISSLQVFSSVCGLTFHSLNSGVWEQNFLFWWSPTYQFFLVWITPLMSYLKCHKDFLRYFLWEILRVCFILGFVINSEFNFLCVVWFKHLFVLFCFVLFCQWISIWPSIISWFKKRQDFSPVNWHGTLVNSVHNKKFLFLNSWFCDSDVQVYLCVRNSLSRLIWGVVYFEIR